MAHRIDRVLEFVTRESHRQVNGMSAEEVAAGLGIARSNASSDLNALWKAGRLVKMLERPVRYRPVNPVFAGAVAVPPRVAPTPVATQQAQVTHNACTPTEEDPFTALVGWKHSLAPVIKQAKAAVLYPGGGLHTLIAGPSGVGKSRLAELMHQFALKSGVLKPDAKLVVFNCADYAHNPQLLMSQLFGVVKGAYTGADRDQAGLVEQADGGILFLDEIHRLVPEGQEMLFRLIDKGVYRRLGESTAERKARTLIVCATTERVDSALLHTFTRRIPMVINIPALAERTLWERMAYVRTAFAAEARKMGVQVTVVPEALRSLLLYNCPGNIGQLSSDIQLACAQGFLRYLSDHHMPIVIDADVLPDHVRRQVEGGRQAMALVEEVLSRKPDGLVLEPGAEAPPELNEDQANRHSTLYEMMERETEHLSAASYSHDDIQRHLADSVETHFQQFLGTVQHRYESSRQQLTTVVPPVVLEAVERAIVHAEGELRRVIPKRVLFGVALHINEALERLKLGRIPPEPPLETIQAQHPQEYAVAMAMIHLLSEQVGIRFPDSEAGYIALFLASEQASADAERIGVAIACHGEGIAARMAAVAEQLAGGLDLIALDLPLDGTVDSVMNLLVQRVKQEQYTGLILLVDMGSLVYMGEKVQFETGVPVRVVPMASTPLLVETIHHLSTPGATVDQVHAAVMDAQRQLADSVRARGTRRPVVVTCCFTGEGSALLLKSVVERALGDRSQLVDVVAMTMPQGGDWQKALSGTLAGRQPVALVGPVAPNIPDVPFFHSGEIVTWAGQERLITLVETRTRRAVPEVLLSTNPRPVDLATTLATSLAGDFFFTNPVTLLPVVLQVIEAMAAKLGIQLSTDMKVGVMMHLAALVERRASERSTNPAPRSVDPRLADLDNCLLPLRETFGVSFLPEDLARLYEILTNTVYRSVTAS